MQFELKKSRCSGAQQLHTGTLRAPDSMSGSNCSRLRLQLQLSHGPREERAVIVPRLRTQSPSPHSHTLIATLIFASASISTFGFSVSDQYSVIVSAHVAL